MKALMCVAMLLFAATPAFAEGLRIMTPQELDDLCSNTSNKGGCVETALREPGTIIIDASLVTSEIKKAVSEAVKAKLTNNCVQQ